jgi:hypothetical protein
VSGEHQTGTRDEPPSENLLQDQRDRLLIAELDADVAKYDAEAAALQAKAAQARADAASIHVDLEQRHLRGPNLFKRGRGPEDLDPESIIRSTDSAQSISARRDAVPSTTSKRSIRTSRVLHSPSDLEVTGDKHCASRPEKTSPDTVANTVAGNSVICDVWSSIEHIMKHATTRFDGKTMSKRNSVSRPRNQFWVETKGLLAVVIASM